MLFSISLQGTANILLDIIYEIEGGVPVLATNPLFIR